MANQVELLRSGIPAVEDSEMENQAEISHPIMKKRPISQITTAGATRSTSDVSPDQASTLTPCLTMSKGTTSDSKRSKRKLSVAFDSSTVLSDSNEKPVKTGCPGLFTEEHRSACWTQPSDAENIIIDLRASIQNCVVKNENFPLYSEALVEAYFACNVRSEPPRVPGELISVIGLANSEGRGLETYSVPTLAHSRLSTRADHIRTIVQLYRALREQGEVETCTAAVGQLSTESSHSSRSFARVMAIGDAFAASFEYTESIKISPPDDEAAAILQCRYEDELVVPHPHLASSSAPALRRLLLPCSNVN